MSRLRAVLLVCGACAAGSAFGASPDPKTLAVPPEDLSKARELVKRLGGESYRDREDASAELSKMGRRAKPALTEGATTETDPEIRARSTRLLPKAEADDLKARLDTFLEDKDGKFEHDLPGLKTFRKAVGATPKARELYAEILKSPYNLEMFQAMDRGNVEGGRAVSDRRNTLWTDMVTQRQFVGGKPPAPPKQPTLPDMAAVLFGESEIPHEHIPRATIQWQQPSGVLLLQQSSVSMQALNGNAGGVAHAEAYQMIVRRWLSTREDPMDLAQLVYQLGQGGALRQFPESLPLIRRMVVLESVQGYSKGQALNILIQRGKESKDGKEEAAFLKALVKGEVRVGDYPDVFKKGDNPDKVVSTGSDAVVTQVGFQRNFNGGVQEVHTVTLRDVAFAYVLTQNGLSMRDYGFETNPPNLNVTPQGFGQYAFTTEEKRHAAFVKYGFRQMKQALKGPNDKEPIKDGGPPIPGTASTTPQAPQPVPAPVIRIQK